MLTDVSWAISFLSEGDENRIQRVIETGIIPSLIKNISHLFLSIMIPSLRAIGNICSGSNSQIDAVIAY